MSATVEPKTVAPGDGGPLNGPERTFRYSPINYLRRYGAAGLVLLNLTCFFILWELFARAEVVSPLFLPRASDMFRTLFEGLSPGGIILQHVFYSMRMFSIGMLAAAAVGIPIGLLMGASKVMDSIFSPYVWAMAALPRVALMPLLILILGFSDSAKFTLIFLSAIFPIIINCMAGVKTVDQSLVRAGQVFGASKTDLYRKVIFPFTLPFIISGVNQGMTRGLVGLVIAEIFGGNKGLGYLTTRAAQSFNPALLYAVLLVLVVFSLGFVQIVKIIETKAAPWRNYGS
ncbi:MAG: ABC transporter permease [Actinobacteria bacterium]|jgi:NitT/TauT family transport system permease protein|nr:ABC transporter permease [Actinomycetota bacterium]